MGRPAPFRLVEMGPGDGTLMSDMLRAARLLPEFLAAADLWLVEVSPPLRAIQAERLADGPAPNWADRLESRARRRAADPGGQRGAGLPAGAPVRADRGGWAERMVGLDGSPLPGRAGVRPARASGKLPHVAFPITSMEGEPSHRNHRRVLARPGRPRLRDRPPRRPRRRRGAADRLRPRRARAPATRCRRSRPPEGRSPLAAPGQADLTVWADFPAVLAAARRGRRQATGPILTQARSSRRWGSRPRPGPGRRPARPGRQAGQTA
jgi:NADH dehydrogenase [ubiquinone] 1 alpha subcomplex assembly factor 7